MIKTYWFIVTDENADTYGEEFFVEVDAWFEDDPLAIAWDIAVENFGDVKMKCLGTVSVEFAEMMGYDTY